MKRREFNVSLAAATAVLVSPFSRASNTKNAVATVGGATPVFSFPNGFASAGNAIACSNDCGLSGSSIVMMGVTGHRSGSFWYSTQQPPNAFTTQFTFQMTGLGNSFEASGLTFCIQNTVTPPGQPGYVGTGYVGDANMCGYGGATDQHPPVDSVMIKFDAGNECSGQAFRPGTLPASTGMYFNGGPSVYPGGSLGLCPRNDLNPSGINFYNGDIFQVTMVYDGSLLTMVLLNTATNAQARFVWPLNLANTTNPTGNYVGFTGGTASVGTFYFTSWSYWSGYNTRVATPTFGPAPGQYPGTQMVTINYPSGSTCYYTTNGLLPTSSSTQYTGPIAVSANTVIQAVAIQSGYTDSLIGTGAYQINTSNVINFPSGFSAGSLVVVGYAYLSGSTIRLTDTTQDTAGAAWFPIPVTVSTFTTNFTLNWGSPGQGMCFVIQNNPPPYTSSTGNAIGWSGGPTAIGAASGALGYGGLNAYNGTNGTSFGMLNSVALVFNQYGGSNDPANSVGIYTNGATPYGVGAQTATGLTFVGSFNVTLSYDGTTLTLSMKSTNGGATFTKSWTINIPLTVGGSTAYVGFTGGTGGAASIQAVQSWTYATTPAQTVAVPAAPTNLRVQ